MTRGTDFNMCPPTGGLRNYRKGYEDGLNRGKAELAEILDKISAEITEKAFTEEIFDEDVFRSTFTENMTREEAECESVIETEIVKLSDVLEILEKYKKEGAE